MPIGHGEGGDHMKCFSHSGIFRMCLLLIAALLAGYAQAAKWPEKPIRLILASPPGSGDDHVARIVAPRLSELLGQQLVIEYRPGAGGLIGQTAALKSAPDGYTFLLAGGSMAGARYANAQATYDVLRDFTPVSLVETSAFIMVVHPTVPAKNLREYVELARSQPGKMTYGTLGAGQIPYWSAVLFNDMARIEALQVSYKAISDTITDVMAGRIDYFFAPTVIALGNRTKLRALGVTTLTRSPALPEVPTIAEAALPGYEMPAWRSIMGPAGVQRDIAAALNAAIARALTMPDIRERLQSAGSEPSPSTPEELAKRYADWIERFGRIAQQAGLKPH
jgi:tripartite-type tricarboxylate transporter receptor subunit TctC